MAEKLSNTQAWWFRWMPPMSIPMHHPETVFAESDPYGFWRASVYDWRFLDEKGQQPNPDFVLNSRSIRALPFCWHEKTSAAVPT